MPYRTAAGAMVDSSDFLSLLEKAEHHSEWKDFTKRRSASHQAGKLRGIGMSLFLEPSGGGAAPQDQVALRFDDAGHLKLYCSAGASGQGHETVFPEMVAAWLGIDAEDITLRAGDPEGPALVGSPAIGSRTGMLVGSVFKRASEEVIDKGRSLAANHLEVDADDVEFVGGRFVVKGTDKHVGMKELIRLHVGTPAHPLDTTTSLPISRAFPSGAHVVEVEIDPETGVSDIVRYTAVDDIGRVINPVLAKGQIFGGIVQSVGQVFGEHCAYDEDDGQLRTGSFMDYTMPRSNLVRDIAMHESAVPEKANLLGAKGAGETGTTGALPACMNAIFDALRGAGVTDFDMPATPFRIWRALQEARKRA
jgi:carbon-monoxide dehydrogenase large subunit